MRRRRFARELRGRPDVLHPLARLSGLRAAGRPGAGGMRDHARVHERVDLPSTTGGGSAEEMSAARDLAVLRF